MQPVLPHQTGEADAGATGRRRLLRALPAALVLGAAVPAVAATKDIVVSCDTTLGPPLRAAAAAYAKDSGVTVNVFPTPPGLVLPQLQRQVQNDIVFTQIGTMLAALDAQVVAKGAPRGGWLNRIVLAAKRGAARAPDKPIAVPDPTPGSDIDGPAILARLGMLPGPMLGVIDTDSVADLVLSGTARAGLMHMTDVRAHQELQVISVITDDIQPAILYSVAVTQLARRPDPAAFVTFLLTGKTAMLLGSLGLETAS